MSSYKDLIDNLTSKSVKSAQVAVDYLENDMLTHVENMLSQVHGVKEWRKRGFLPIFENPTRIMVERSSKSYKEAPKRSVVVGESTSEGQTEIYNDLLKTTNINFIGQDLDARARLLKASILLPQVDMDGQGRGSGKINLSVLSRNNCDIKINRMTGEIEGLLYTSGIVGLHDGQIYHHWTPELITDIEGDKVTGERENPYGMVPAAILHDTRPPASGKLWSYPSWEQLIQFSDGLNLFNTEALYNARFAMVGAPVTNMKIPEGTVIGIGAPLKLGDSAGGDTPFFEYSSPSANVTEFMAWLQPFKEAIADEMGVNLNYAGGGSAESGFKLIVEEFENIELRQQRIIAAKQFEQDLYHVFAVMSQVHDWKLDINGIGVADFTEPALPVNKIEDWTIAKEQLALGILSPEEYWQMQDPDLTIEQLAVKRRAYDKSRGLAATVPSFEGV